MRRCYLNEIKQNFKNYNPWIFSLLLADDVILLASSGSGFQLIQSSMPSVKQQELWESRPLTWVSKYFGVLVTSEGRLPKGLGGRPH